MMYSCPVSTFLVVLCVLIVGGYAATLNTTTTTTTTIKAPTTKTPTKAPTNTTTTTKARTTPKTILTKAPTTTKTTIKKTTTTTQATKKLPTTSTKTTTKASPKITKKATAAATLSPSTTKSSTNPENCEGLDKSDLDNPCAYCFCNNGRYECWYQSCMAPYCVDAVTIPGECCPHCPHGDNCQIGGHIIPVSQTHPRIRRVLVCLSQGHRCPTTRMCRCHHQHADNHRDDNNYTRQL